MKLSLTSLTALLGFTASAAAYTGASVFDHVNDIKAAVLENRDTFRPVEEPKLEKRNSRFLNADTKKFVVDGTKIPEVPFDIGESYAGLLPISKKKGETRKLFFWFFPSKNPKATDEITAWFNGGPGCSSLSGLLTENGPFTWEAGTKAPTQNPYTWVNLTNTIWIEQPVGVGYTQGVPDIKDEVALAKEFIGFYKNFVDTFKAYHYKTYLTGESYGGYYVPYIADAFINADDKKYYNLAGVAINDPIIGDGTIQQQVVVMPFVDYWSELFYLNATFTDKLHKRADQCGYTTYLEKYYKFPPPPGKFPLLPDPFATDTYKCDMFDNVFGAAILSNPCFNIYHITDTCPHLWSQLGIVNTGDYNPPGEVVYFNRTDVQKAINAPVGTNWMQCTDKNVFGRGTNNPNLSDASLGPAQDGVLSHVIDSIKNVWIGVGNLDFILPTNGTVFAMQNMTWGGKQGWQKYPAQHTFYVPYHPEYNGGALSAAGDVGSWHSERGVTFYQVQLGGHELPGYAPGAGYRMLEAMLGRIKDLSEVSDFTTQTGDFTGTSTIYKREEEEVEVPRKRYEYAEMHNKL